MTQIINQDLIPSYVCTVPNKADKCITLHMGWEGGGAKVAEKNFQIILEDETTCRPHRNLLRAAESESPMVKEKQMTHAFQPEFL